MKISNIIFIASILILASCSGNEAKEHGHEHKTEEHGHEHNGEEHNHHEEIQQEEFTISGDSIQIEAPAHNHPHNDENEQHSH